MSLTFDVFTAAFLSKISEYDFLEFDDAERDATVDEYLQRAVAQFKHICKYDLTSAMDKENRVFDLDIDDADADEIVDIISEGMVRQWLKIYLNKQELLEMGLNTRDFTAYSPAELLRRVGDAYDRVKKEYTQMIREYSYTHGDLTRLHIN
jgi:hypothetical protein